MQQTLQTHKQCLTYTNTNTNLKNNKKICLCLFATFIVCLFGYATSMGNPDATFTLCYDLNASFPLNIVSLLIKSMRHTDIQSD